MLHPGQVLGGSLPLLSPENIHGTDKLDVSFINTKITALKTA